MSPNSVGDFVVNSKLYPQLVVERRRNPDGWSFFVGPKVGGPSPNRIFRVVATTPSQSSNLKLAITSRLSSDLEFIFRGDEAELKALIDRELKLYLHHFDGHSR